MDRSILIFLLLVHLNLPSQLIAQEIMVNQQEEGGIQNSTIRTKDKPPVESGAEGEYEEAQERIGGKHSAHYCSCPLQRTLTWQHSLNIGREYAFPLSQIMNLTTEAWRDL